MNPSHSLPKLVSSLPANDKKVLLGNNTFQIYCAKELFQDAWTHPTLHRLVLEARKTYQEIYGDIDLLDKYDKKSAIYLIRVTYPFSISHNKSIEVEEWFSLRFVPAAHTPVSNEDLNFYMYKNGSKKLPVWEYIVKHFLTRNERNHKSILREFIALSRFCAIRPYATDAKNQRKLDLYNQKVKNPLKNKFSGISFALMNEQFFSMAVEQDLPFTYVTAQLNQSMINTILSYKTASQIISLPFIKATDALKLKADETIVLNRNKHDIPVFLYPGYFLNKEELSHVFTECVTTGVLSEATFMKYLPKDVQLSDVIAKPRMIHFQKAGKLLSMKGAIHHDKITGEDLRRIVNERVSDGPSLYIMQRPEWQKGIRTFLSTVHSSM